MYNGYEIWKSDAEKCARYRITNQGGGMCGRCMKTCPWNLEGLFAESGVPLGGDALSGGAALLAALDDRLGRGGINPVKKWWWDIELDRATGSYVRAKADSRARAQPELDLKYEDQTLAVYPADVMPRPFRCRSRSIARRASSAIVRCSTPRNTRRASRAARPGLVPPFSMPEGRRRCFRCCCQAREEMAEDIARFEFARPTAANCRNSTPARTST